jgi:hypothetical protein
VIDQSLASRDVGIYDISTSSPSLVGSFGQSVFSEPNPGLYADDRYRNFYYFVSVLVLVSFIFVCFSNAVLDLIPWLE